MFGVAFLYSGGLWFLFIVEVSPSGWGRMIGLSRFPGQGKLASVIWWVELDFFSLFSKTVGCFSGC